MPSELIVMRAPPSICSSQPSPSPPQPSPPQPSLAVVDVFVTTNGGGSGPLPTLCVCSTTGALQLPAPTSLVPRTRNAFEVEIGLLAAVFVLLSALAHLLVLIFWDAYLADIKRETNRARWYEYAISSSIMICSIAVLFGCYDLGSLILMFMINAVMNLCGLLMERMNPPERTEVDWSPFAIGCIAGIAPWIVVVQYFVGGGNFDQIPGFVYGILVGYFIFFNTFPVNMVLQYARVGKWADYRYGEKVYIVLSLASKSLLTWLVFGGTFQPN